MEQSKECIPQNRAAGNPADSQDDQQSWLLDLPPELWLRICEYAVKKPKPIRVGKEPNPKDQMAVVQQPAITRTCRLLRIEALPMYYTLNTFEMLHCFGVPCPRKWIVAIGAVHRQRMKSMLMSKSDPD